MHDFVYYRPGMSYLTCLERRLHRSLCLGSLSGNDNGVMMKLLNQVKSQFVACSLLGKVVNCLVWGLSLLI